MACLECDATFGCTELLAMRQHQLSHKSDARDRRARALSVLWAKEEHERASLTRLLRQEIDQGKFDLDVAMQRETAYVNQCRVWWDAFHAEFGESW